MDLFMFVLSFTVVFALGYLVGLLQKGIRIVHEQPEQQFQGYNEPIMDNISPEIKEYLDRMNGQIGG